VVVFNRKDGAWKDCVPKERDAVIVKSKKRYSGHNWLERVGLISIYRSALLLLMVILLCYTKKDTSGEDTNTDEAAKSQCQKVGKFTLARGISLEKSVRDCYT